MSLLAFDTCFSACSVAARNDATGKVAMRCERMDIGHAERLLPMIGEVMQEAGLPFAALTRLAVTNGPGSFTGVRIGIAAARAFGLTHGPSVHAVSSLSVMAWEARELLEAQGHPANTVIAVAVDARRDRLYFQMFSADGSEIAPPALVAPERAADQLADRRVVVGSGAQILSSAARAIGRAVDARFTDLQPNAAFMLRMPLCAAAVEPIGPLYLRAPDAKPPAAAALRRAR